tara:strand:- start:3298 stop:5184 length:1887 start_codon:yes stop_codon:yes gene_type:complete
MGEAIENRGPDSHGEWSDKKNIGLSHRRLSIFDLSPSGHQPMHSPNNRFVLAFNGEIYNFLEIKEFIEKNYCYTSWNGTSDTEVLITCIEHIGVEETLKKCIGMFAFSLWDKKEKTLTLARDRLGEKPLYYGWNNNTDDSSFLFGSDLNALKAYPDFNSTIDKNALSLYMRYSYVPTPYSIFANISKLKPGCFLTMSLGKKNYIIESYWSAIEMSVNGSKNLFRGDCNKIVDNLENVLIDSVRLQMNADVPVGAFLSGGVDSSAVVALMQEQSTKPIETFSIGFNDANFNEADHAKKISQHLNTNHNELYVSAEDTLAAIPTMSSIYSEPFADSSQIPTYIVSKLARQKVTVSLSGDGGDELFGGYNRYILINRMWKYISKVPSPMRKTISNMFLKIKPNDWEIFFKAINPIIPRNLRQSNWGNKIQKSLQILALKKIEDVYLSLTSSGAETYNLVLDSSSKPKSFLSTDTDLLSNLSDLEKMMTLDTITYLPDDILTKVDRSTMAVSLEARVPFLDYRVVEFSSRIPTGIKINKGVGKWPLREVLYKYVPKELIERPKMGFSIPLSEWLKDSLKDWAENLINESRIKSDGYLCPKTVNKLWDEHQTGSHDRSQILWNILMFQSWLHE